MEIERKFLIKSSPRNLSGFPCTHIRQGYFPLADKNLEIRLREKGSEHFVTIKAGRGRARLEEEVPISKKQFDALWPLVRANCIEKKRYRIPCDGRTIELDLYQGRHRGLKTADIEFRSTNQSDAFEPPDWLGTEITGKRRYANETLARRGRT
jgi:CYTH domain-containing protein